MIAVDGSGGGSGRSRRSGRTPRRSSSGKTSAAFSCPVRPNGNRAYPPDVATSRMSAAASVIRARAWLAVRSEIAELCRTPHLDGGMVAFDGEARGAAIVAHSGAAPPCPPAPRQNPAPSEIAP